MRPPWLPPRRIFHPTDLTRGSETAFAHALKLALAAQGHLDILHIDTAPGRAPWSEYPGVRSTLAHWGVLRKGATKPEVGEAGLYVRKIRAHGFGVVRPVLRELRETGADLIVLATHGRDGLDRWLHRDIAEKLSREGCVPTLFVPYGTDGFVSLGDGSTSLHRVLVPIDSSPRPQSAVDAASMVVQLAGLDTAAFTLLHVGNDRADAPAVDLPAHEGWSWETTVQRGDVVKKILSLGQQQPADLIVMSTHGHDGFLDAIRGSTTERVLAAAACPVLAVPASSAER
ncbi:MAG: universal stress protein [Acidobacteriota bacterium]